MKDNSRFNVPVLTFLTLAATILLIRFWPAVPDDIQDYVCKAENCTIQDWLSATAGWVGFVAAAVGAYFVFVQLAEMKRQTAFMVGDGDPTMHYLENASISAGATIQIVNWNRRAVSLYAFEIVCDAELPPIDRLSIHLEDRTSNYDILKDGKLVWAPVVYGWHNRSASPQTMNVTPIFATSAHMTDFPSDPLQPVTFKIVIHATDDGESITWKRNFSDIRVNMLPADPEFIADAEAKKATW